MIESPSALRIWKAAGIAVVASLIGNEIIRAVTATAYGISPAFQPLEPGKIAFFTVVGTIGAAIVRTAVYRAQQPARLFDTIAVLALALSLIPDVLILLNPMPGTSLPEVVALMCMHVITAAVCITLLRLPSRYSRTS